ncbi:MAG: ABC transporter ATP-binding protein [Candidatus Cloacimonadales bacterium]|nr:ABC transporter ATP-binding protein [Candidatus Cloacimonadales bacterium]
MNKNAVISISNLKMKYSEEYVLKGIDLQISPGQIISYIGPNGAGKTTTIKVLLGMIDDFEGKVEIFGQEITGGDIEYKKKIGYVPEGGQLYETLTGQEYIEFIGKIYGLEDNVVSSRGQKMVELFGFDKALNDRISSYSKGMKQKLLIVTALIHNPEIIILDEPLNGLDANSVLVFKEVLSKLAKAGKTIFYSSHLMDVVEKISNRIVLIFEGKIIADGTFEELQKLSEKGSLEGIFNELTGFHEHEQIAEKIIAALEN